MKNPATGKLQLDLLGEPTEIRYGMDADAALSAQIGLYPDEALQAWVAELGAELAAASERPHLPWTFRVLDDETVNAFAVPGGHVYVTRGLLAHLQHTDELVAVLGHEVGHVAARHSVTQLSRGALLGVGVGAVSVLDPRQRHVGGLAARGAESLYLSFGRQHELMADELGVRYVRTSGRDPHAFLRVFDMLEDVEEAATGGERLPTRLRTHPQSAERRDRIAAWIGDGPPLPPEAGMLARVDGLVVGPDPRAGFFVGGTFLHPELAFKLAWPEGWEGVNLRHAVAAVHPDGDAVLQLTPTEAESAEAGLQAFLARVAPQQEVTDPPEGVVFQISGPAGILSGVVSYVEHDGSVFELLGVAAQPQWGAREGDLRAGVGGLAALEDPAVLGVEPMRIAVVEVEAPTTLRALEEAAPSSLPLDAMVLLNGLEPDTELAAGTLVKRVVGFHPDDAPQAWGR